MGDQRSEIGDRQYRNRVGTRGYKHPRLPTRLRAIPLSAGSRGGRPFRASVADRNRTCASSMSRPRRLHQRGTDSIKLYALIIPGFRKVLFSKRTQCLNLIPGAKAILQHVLRANERSYERRSRTRQRPPNPRPEPILPTPGDAARRSPPRPDDRKGDSAPQPPRRHEEHGATRRALRRSLSLPSFPSGRGGPANYGRDVTIARGWDGRSGALCRVR